MRARRGGAPGRRPAPPWARQRAAPAWQERQWEEPQWQEPTWLESQLGARLPRQPQRRKFNQPLRLGENLVIRTREGFRAVGQEIKKDQWLVSLVPAGLDEQLAGIGFVGPVINLANTAIKSIVDAVDKGKARREGASAPAARQPPPQLEVDIGCAGPCRCGGHRGW
jgi:hypothetical protein